MIATQSNPAGVLAVYDNGGKTIDRYCVVFNPGKIGGQVFYAVLTMSPDPSGPYGVGHASLHRHRPTEFLGEKKIGLDALPAACQRLVMDYLAPARQRTPTPEEQNTMPIYLIRFDDGRESQQFEAIGDSEAADYAQELLLDDTADGGEEAAVYRLEEGGAEEHVATVTAEGGAE